jgi:alpha-tubulin suppressor-like RCC1 family protein
VKACAAALLAALSLAACEDPAGPTPPDAAAPRVQIVAEHRAWVTAAGSVEIQGELADSVGVVRAAVRVNDEAEVPAEITPGKAAAIRATVTLRAGSNMIRLLGYDAAGNMGVDSVQVVLDQTGPLIEVKLPTSMEVTPGAVRFFVGVGDRSPIGSVTASVNGAAPVPMRIGCLGEGLYACGRNGVNLQGWELTLSTLQAGANRIVVRARDALGNESTLDYVLALVPRVAVTSPKLGESVGADSASVTATVEFVDRITRVGYRVNGGPETTAAVSMGMSGSFALAVPLVDANNFIEVAAYDAAGNRGHVTTQVVRPARSVASGPFTSITAGLHACALTAEGVAYCWGGNSHGQLGTGDRVASTAPRRVAGNLVFASLSAAEIHTCGVTRDGAAYCWGGNDQGQLGTGGTAGALVPARVPGAGEYTAIEAAHTATCALGRNGAVSCWGRSNVLGPQAPACADRQDILCSPVPVAVPSTSTYRSLSMYGSHACAVTAAGSADCWGSGGWSALGHVTNADARTPAPVQGGRTFAAVSAGGIHSCGVTADAKAFCWGKNLYGELGDGSQFTERNAPREVALTERIATISAGSNFTCALTEAGQLYCWGERYAGGQLGPGYVSGGGTAVPTRVVGGVTLRTLEAGYGMACGLTPLGAAYCWGGPSVAPSRVPNPAS